jgi:hypothetical protein
MTKSKKGKKGTSWSDDDTIPDADADTPDAETDAETDADADAANGSGKGGGKSLSARKAVLEASLTPAERKVAAGLVEEHSKEIISLAYLSLSRQSGGRVEGLTVKDNARWQVWIAKSEKYYAAGDKAQGRRYSDLAAMFKEENSK